MARLSEPQDQAFQALSSSIKFDYRLAPYDIEQSRAHVKMLAKCGIVTGDDRDALERGLDRVGAEFEDGHFEVKADDEDIHTAIERRLTEVVGAVGGKLHTARSRNDQVVTDLALYVRTHTHTSCEGLGLLLRALLDSAEGHLDWPMPGYTHLQRAQGVYLSHHLLAYFWMFKRDLDRFRSCLGSTSKLPLGAGALAGVNWETDRGMVAEALGFEGVMENSIDAVSSRDFVLDYLTAASTCATHLSRLGAEIVLWSSEEFGFCEVTDSFASTSSIMPQKKNPDAAELMRAKAPRVVGNLVRMYGVMHALPLTYNKDLQEDKEGLFDTVETMELCLGAAAEMLRGITFNRERMATAASDEFLVATDIADLLVRRGVPFREAHSIVADLVRTALEQGKGLSELDPDELKGASELLDAEYYEVLKGVGSLEAKVSEGGTSSTRITEQLDAARTALRESVPDAAAAT